MGQKTLGTIWEVPDELWERLKPIILEADPPKARGRKRADPRQSSMASSSGCAAGAKGTDCQKNLETTALSIALFNGGWAGVCCAECGELWWRGAKSWAAWLGMASGRRAMGKHVLGDLIGPNPTAVARLVASGASLWMERVAH